MKRLLAIVLVLVMSGVAYAQIGAFRTNPYDSQSFFNPYGAGSSYRTDGFFNPYSRYSSPYSSRSWSNPYATSPPRMYSRGRYYGEYSTNPYRSDSISNPYGRFGNPYSADSLSNPYGLGNPYLADPIDVYP